MATDGETRRGEAAVEIDKGSGGGGASAGSGGGKGGASAGGGGGGADKKKARKVRRRGASAAGNGSASAAADDGAAGSFESAAAGDDAPGSTEPSAGGAGGVVRSADAAWLDGLASMTREQLVEELRSMATIDAMGREPTLFGFSGRDEVPGHKMDANPERSAALRERRVAELLRLAGWSEHRYALAVAGEISKARDEAYARCRERAASVAADRRQEKREAEREAERLRRAADDADRRAREAEAAAEIATRVPEADLREQYLTVKRDAAEASKTYRAFKGFRETEERRMRAEEQALDNARQRLNHRVSEIARSMRERGIGVPAA